MDQIVFYEDGTTSIHHRGEPAYIPEWLVELPVTLEPEQPEQQQPDWVAAIQRERAYQDAKWGTVEQNPHSLIRWLILIREEYCEAAARVVEDRPEEALAEIVQMAALCAACLEQHGIVERPQEELDND